MGTTRPRSGHARARIALALCITWIVGFELLPWMHVALHDHLAPHHHDASGAVVLAVEPAHHHHDDDDLDAEVDEHGAPISHDDLDAEVDDQWPCAQTRAVELHVWNQPCPPVRGAAPPSASR